MAVSMMAVYLLGCSLVLDEVYFRRKANYFYSPVR